MNCKACNKPLEKKQRKYCTNLCQHNQQYLNYISAWKKGASDGNRGIKIKLLSKHLKRYLLLKYDEKCMQCGWCKRHSITNSVPLEVDHIDGNAENNLENNLRLLCPNCHSLTSSFRNLNKGRGRAWRNT